MLVEVEIEEDIVEVPGGKPVPGLCGLCGNCNLEISVTGINETATAKLLRAFARKCPEGFGNRYVVANIDDRHMETPKDD